MFGPRAARQTLSVPMRRAFSFVREQIETDTPVDTGNLVSHTALWAGIANRDERRTFPDAVFAVRAGWRYPSPSTLTFQGLAVEFGTRFQPPQRILRGALEDNVQLVLDVFMDEMRDRVEAAAIRLARRAARRR